MEKLLMFLVICVFSKANTQMFGNHTEIVRSFEEYARSAPGQPVFMKLPCGAEIDAERELVTQESKCGQPRKVLFDLQHLPRAAHEEIHPKALWVNQCVGLCDGEGSDYKCMPGKTLMRHIPVRIVNSKTVKEACAVYTIEEPTTCTCCQDTKPEFCTNKGKVFVPGKCACNCPNQDEKRDCLAKKLEWDRTKCACETQTGTAPSNPTPEISRRELGAKEEELGLHEFEDLQK